MPVLNKHAGSLTCPHLSLGAANPVRCGGAGCAAWRKTTDGERGWCGLSGAPESVRLDFINTETIQKLRDAVEGAMHGDPITRLAQSFRDADIVPPDTVLSQESVRRDKLISDARDFLTAWPRA